MLLRVKLINKNNDKEELFEKEIPYTNESISELLERFNLHFPFKDKVCEQVYSKGKLDQTLTYDYKLNDFYIKFSDIILHEARVSPDTIKQILYTEHKELISSTYKVYKQLKEKYNISVNSKWWHKKQMSQEDFFTYNKYRERLPNSYDSLVHILDNFSELYQEKAKELVENHKIECEKEYNDYHDWFIDNGWVVTK